MAEEEVIYRYPNPSPTPVDMDISSSDILIIEDEELMAALVQRYIQVFSEESRKALKMSLLPSGWQLLTQDLSHVKVAVVDILLPKVNGVDLIRHFRSHFPMMGIVPITGMATAPMKRQILEVLPRGCGILEKPLRKNLFLDTFSSAYDYYQQTKAIPVKLEPKVPEQGSEEVWTSAVARSIPTAQFKKKPPTKIKAA